jgi:tetratricopeptide (TPR) repeat protein
LAPQKADIVDNLALTHLKMGQHDKAIDLYLESLALEPHRASAYNNLGLAYKQAGRYGQAVQAYRRALDLETDYPDPLRNLGVIYAYHLDDPAQAVRLWEQYLGLRPDDPDAGDIRAEMERIRQFLAEDDVHKDDVRKDDVR